MNIKQITTTLVALALCALPAVSFASTYQYVDTMGKIQSVQAANSSDAFAKAYNISSQSGVMMVGTGSTVSTSTSTSESFYQYVDRNGNVQNVNAVNSSAALATAYNIGANSGVMLVTNNTSI